MPPSDTGTCANCGTRLDGPFCHACGQEAVELRRPLSSLVRDALGDLLAFDSRILRTLRPLLLRPGFLTREWMRGRRVPYVPPLRLYVFIAAVFFLILGWTDVSLVEVKETGERSAAQVGAGNMAKVEVFERKDIAEAEPEDGPEEGVLDRFGDRLGEAMSRDPKEFSDDVVTHLGRISLLMPPFFALLLALLYKRRRLVLVEHVVFAVHLHAFVVLLSGAVFVTSLWVPRLAGGILRLAMLLAIGLYLLVALHRVYGGRWWGTLLRGALLVLLYMLLIFLPALFLALLLTVSLG